MSFANPMLLVLLLAIVPILWLASKRRKSVGHPQVDMHKNLRGVPLAGWIPILLLVAFWSALVVGIARPRLTEHTEKQTIQSRDFVVVVDVSGSMSSALQDPAQQTFAGQQPGQTTGQTPNSPTTTPTDPPKPPTRANAAREGVRLFVKERNGDRVALMLFDDQVYYVWPLTTDLSVIDKKLPLIDQYNGGGTNFAGPDPDNSWSKRGGIQGAIDHFRDASTAKTKVLIMVTDGEDSMNPKRVEQLTQQMRELGIKIYVLGVGEGWVNGGTNDLRQFTENLGGKVIPVGDAQQMRDGFALISQLEKSQVVIERETGYREIYQYFLIAGVIFGCLYLLSAALVREDA